LQGGSNACGLHPQRRPRADDAAVLSDLPPGAGHRGARRGCASGGAELTEALSEAYRSNPQLLAQWALLRATDELMRQALANWRPTVGFTGQTGYAVGTLSAPGGQTAYSHSKPSSLDLTATQPVYRGGRTAAQVRQAIAEFNLAAAIGRFIAPELRLPVRLYDMDRHYKAVKDKWIGFAGGLSQ
jgi:hypothetical protein